MDNLTAAQIKVLDFLSDVRDPSLNLGTKLDQIIRSLPETGTPVNAVNAGIVLTLTGVVIDGEKVTIDNPLVAGSDVYEFLADEAQTKSQSSNIAVDITDYATKATINLTVDTQPTSGDTMTIDTKEYIFVPHGTATEDREIALGAALADTKLNIVAAINGTDGHNDPHPTVTAAAFVADVCAITALVGGTAKNTLATTETFTAATNVFADTSLNGGTDCSAANAITALVAAVTASDTQGVGAADGDGDTVNFSADTAGAAGNNISITENMANATLAGGGTHLTGGVDGTVGSVNKLYIDSSYLYEAIADNTVSGKNWRRISVGAQY